MEIVTTTKMNKKKSIIIPKLNNREVLREVICQQKSEKMYSVSMRETE
jgi:hypothetical protein